MGKKCIPGVVCFENVTILILAVIGSMVFYLYYVHITKNMTRPTTVIMGAPTIGADSGGYPPVPPLAMDSRIEMSNPYMPPLKNDNAIFGGVSSITMPIVTRQSVGIPINIQTSTANTSYSQSGILTKQGNSGEQMILPLMGRNLLNGRDKWQYYTMTNGAGSINTKLPISVNGKSCTGEYGCDSISTGDIVYVEGYNDTFRATVYENALMQYLPL